MVAGKQKASTAGALASSQALCAGLARLAGGAQAFGAELQLNRNAAIERERRLLNVWLPHAAGKIVSVADVVAKRGFFAAELTLCHDKTNLLDQGRAFTKYDCDTKLGLYHIRGQLANVPTVC